MSGPVKPRVGTLLREKDGDFNPGWLIAGGVSAVGAIGCGIIFVGLLTQRGGVDAVLVGMAFAFLSFTMVAWLTGVYSLGKAKVLNESAVLKELAGVYDVDERDEDQRARGD